MASDPLRNNHNIALELIVGGWLSMLLCAGCLVQLLVDLKRTFLPWLADRPGTTDFKNADITLPRLGLTTSMKSEDRSMRRPAYSPGGFMHKSAVRLPVILCSLLLAFTIGGCSPQPGGPPATDPPAANKQQNAGTDSNDEPKTRGKDREPLPEVDLPTDFPAEIPLHDGPITRAVSLTEQFGSGYWDVHVRPTNAPDAIRTVRKELVDAGFVEGNWMEVGDRVSARFDSDKYRIAIQDGSDINGFMLAYTISEQRDE